MGGPAVDKGQLAGLGGKNAVGQLKLHAPREQTDQKEVLVAFQPGHAAAVRKTEGRIIKIVSAPGHIEKKPFCRGGGRGEKPLGLRQHAWLVVDFHDLHPLEL